MAVTEDELLNQLAIAAKEVDEARLSIKNIKKMAVEVETVFINAKLNEEKLQEQYREFKNRQVPPATDLSETEIDIERFKLLLPDLLKKV